MQLEIYSSYKYLKKKDTEVWDIVHALSNYSSVSATFLKFCLIYSPETISLNLA
jgi:hypothetical protein